MSDQPGHSRGRAGLHSPPHVPPHPPPRYFSPGRHPGSASECGCAGRSGRSGNLSPPRSSHRVDIGITQYCLGCLCAGKTVGGGVLTELGKNRFHFHLRPERQQYGRSDKQPVERIKPIDESHFFLLLPFACVFKLNCLLNSSSLSAEVPA